MIALVIFTGSYLYITENTKKPEDVERPVKHVADLDRDLSQNMKEIPNGFFIEPLPELGIQAKSVILINTQNGDILYNKNIDKSLPVASMSKIMTELLVLEAIREKNLLGHTSFYQRLCLCYFQSPRICFGSFNKGTTLYRTRVI